MQRIWEGIPQELKSTLRCEGGVMGQTKESGREKPHYKLEGGRVEQESQW